MLVLWLAHSVTICLVTENWSTLLDEKHQGQKALSRLVRCNQSWWRILALILWDSPHQKRLYRLEAESDARNHFVLQWERSKSSQLCPSVDSWQLN